MLDENRRSKVSIERQIFVSDKNWSKYVLWLFRYKGTSDTYIDTKCIFSTCSGGNRNHIKISKVLCEKNIASACVASQNLLSLEKNEAECRLSV